MMNRKQIVTIALSCVAVLLCATGIVWKGYRTVHPKERVVINETPTDKGLFFDDSAPAADPLIVGHWTNKQNPQWHKVYYDDFDDEVDQFWGKEWDESEDIYEADLKYHGNGWFRWKKEGNMLHEFATMDYRDVPIHRGYKIVKSTEDSLCYFEAERKGAVMRFAKR